MGPNKRKSNNPAGSKLKRLKTDDSSPLFDFSSPLSTFESLIAPSSYEDFTNNVWERKPLVSARSSTLSEEKTASLSKIFSTEFLETVTDCMRLEFGRDLHICRFDGKKTVDVPEKGHLTTGKMRKLLSQKCTFQIHQPQRYSDLLWRILENLESLFGCLVGCNVYITPPGSQGLAPHYDDVEVFILQLQGSKHWKLYKPQVELSRDYVANLDPSQLGDPIEDFVLNPGDFLYFPRGTVHQAFANEGDECSTHVTISTYQHQSYGDYLRSGIFQSLEEMIKSSVDFRKGLPIGSLLRPDLRFSVDGSATNDSMASHLKHLMEQLSKSMQKCPTPDGMLMDFWASRLPPFGVDLEKLKDGQPDSPLPSLRDRVRLRHKNHICVFERDVGDEMEDDESDEEEDGPTDGNNVSSTMALCVLSSLMNSREEHMVMSNDDSDEKEMSEPAISIRFPLSFKGAMNLLLEKDIVDVKDLQLEDDDKTKLLNSLWSCQLLEVVKS